MKILTRMFLFLVVVVLLLLVGSLFIPKNWQVTSATAIKADPMDVFQVVNNLQTWGEWTVWTKEKYPEMSRRYEGPESGKGAIMKWDDGNMEGVIEVKSAAAPSFLEYDLSMDNGKYIMVGSFEFMPDAEGTRVTWACSGEGESPVSKYMMLVFKPMMRKDFETGLANLKARMEQP